MKKNLSCHLKISIEKLLLRKAKEEPYLLLAYEADRLIAKSDLIPKGTASSEFKEMSLEFCSPWEEIQAREIEFRVALRSCFQRRVTSRARVLLSSLKTGKEQSVVVSPSKENEGWLEMTVEQKLFPNTGSEKEKNPIVLKDNLEGETMDSIVKRLGQRFEEDIEKPEWKSSIPKLWKRRLMKYLEKWIINMIQTKGYLPLFDREMRMSARDESMHYYLTPRSAESKMYVFGDDQMQNVYEFNFNVEKFKKIEKPSNIFMFGYSMSCALPNGKIMITGGINKSLNIIVSTAYWYDPIKNRIELLSDMKQSRYTHTICYHDGYVYVLGGRYYGKDKEGVLAHMERYSIARNVWEALKPMREKRCTAAAIVYKDNMYVFGGYQGTGRLNTIEKYDLIADDWSKVPMVMPHSIEAGCAFLCSNEGKIVYLAGKEDKMNSTECIVYDIVNNTFEKQQKLNAGRVLPRYALYKKQIYVFGGAGMTWEKAEINKWDWTNQGSYIDTVNSEMKLFSSAAKKEMPEIAPNILLEPFPVFFSGSSSTSKLDFLFLQEKPGSLEKSSQFYSYEYRDGFRLNSKEAGCAPTVLGYVLVVGGVDALGNVLRDSHLVNQSEIKELMENPKRLSHRIINLVPTQPMRHERKRPTVCAFSSFNYVFGGINRQGKVWSSCERFNFEANEWHPITDMPFALHSAKAIEIDQDRIVLIGGYKEIDQSSMNKSLLVYTVSTNSWSVVTSSLPNVLFEGGLPNAVGFEGSLYLFPWDCRLCSKITFETETIFEPLINLDAVFSKVYSVYVTHQEIDVKALEEKISVSEPKEPKKASFLRIFGKLKSQSELHMSILDLPSLKPSTTGPVLIKQEVKGEKEQSEINLDNLETFLACPFSPYQKSAYIDAMNFMSLQLVNNKRRQFIFTKDSVTNKPSILTYSYLSETFQAIVPPKNFIHLEGSCAVGLANGTILVTGGHLLSGTSVVVKKSAHIFNPFANTWTETSHMSTPRTSHCMVEFKGGVFAIGGLAKANFASSSLCSTEIFSQFQWKDGPSLSVGRSGFGAAVMSNGIYVIGGKDSKGEGIDTVERFNIEIGVWEPCEQKLPHPMSSARAVTLSYNQIVILSSNSGDPSFSNTLYLLEFQGQKNFSINKTFKTLFLYKSAPQFSTVGNKLFLLGGNLAGKSEKVQMDQNGLNESGFSEVPSCDNLVNGNLFGATSAISEVDYSQTSYKVSERNHRFLYIFGTETNPIIEKLDLESMTWTEVPKPSNLSIWDYSIALTLPNGQIFICGGINSQLNNIKRSAFLITPEKGENSLSCEKLPDMQQDRYTHTCGFVNNYVYVMGGRNFGHGLQGVLQHCERLNLITKKWERIAPLKAKRCTATAFSFKNSIYIVGGFRGDGRVKCIEKYNEAIDEWMSVPLLLYHPVEAETLIHLSDKEILLLGGKDDFAEQQYLSMYNFERNTCVMMKPEKFMTATRVLAKSAKYKDQIVVIGGNQTSSSEQANIWELKWVKFNNTFKLISNNFTRTAFAQSY